MRTIAAVLFLSVVLLMTAGCVTTTDPIVGTWKNVSGDVGEGDDVQSMMFLFDEGGAGYVTITNSAGSVSIFPAEWKKTGDNTYQYEMFMSFTRLSDGKSFVSNYGKKYTGGTNLTEGVWVQESGREYHFEFAFYENGTGREWLYVDGVMSEEAPISWREFEDGVYLYKIIHTVKFSEDKKTMTDIYGATCTESGGVWTENYAVSNGRYVYTYEFMDGGRCEVICYNAATGDAYAVYYYVWEDVDDTTRVMKYQALYDVVINADGTLSDVVSGTVLKKTSA